MTFYGGERLGCATIDCVSAWHVSGWPGGAENAVAQGPIKFVNEVVISFQ